ncbi:hypothetical protein OK074_3402 [Actinobacteria bacterium OK074]|nr:hypothetical protein OK074_3402 [Actinobacteria bacterium OK074]
MVGCGLSGGGAEHRGRTVADISRRTVLGAAGTAAAVTLLAAAGTIPAAAADDTGENTSQATTQETDTAMAVTTEAQKFEAFVANDEGEYLAHAVFDANANTDDIWVFVDAAKARAEQHYPNSTFTGTVRRYDQVITDIAHP